MGIRRLGRSEGRLPLLPTPSCAASHPRSHHRPGHQQRCSLHPLGRRRPSKASRSPLYHGPRQRLVESRVEDHACGDGLQNQRPRKNPCRLHRPFLQHHRRTQLRRQFRALGCRFALGDCLGTLIQMTVPQRRKPSYCPAALVQTSIVAERFFSQPRSTSSWPA